MSNRVQMHDELCCGCGLCAAICPVGAISMIKGNLGFLYPEISSEKCIQCGKCNRVCDFSKKVELRRDKI